MPSACIASPAETRSTSARCSRRPGWTVPLSVTDAVLARVSRLSADARGLVDLVSVAPGGLEPEIAGRVCSTARTQLSTKPSIAASSCSSRHSCVVPPRARAPRDRGRGRRPAGGASSTRCCSRCSRRDGRGSRSSRTPRRRRGRRRARAAVRARGRARGVSAAVRTARPRASSNGRWPMPARCRSRELADLLSLLAEERIGFDAPADRAELLERIVALRRECGDALGLGATLALLARTFWTMGRIREAFDRVAEAVEVLEPLPEGPEHRARVRRLQPAGDARRAATRTPFSGEHARSSSRSAWGRRRRCGWR